MPITILAMSNKSSRSREKLKLGSPAPRNASSGLRICSKCCHYGANIRLVHTAHPRHESKLLRIINILRLFPPHTTVIVSDPLHASDSLQTKTRTSPN